MSTKFLLLGGFLGAGKTTLLIALARYLRSQGHRVAAITNDQGENLIDTQRVSADGIVAEEVLNGCFCCRFDQLSEVLGKLTAASEPPDFVLAEAVGSCTDLTATVLKPMLSQSTVQVCPLVVVSDPHRILRIFGEDVDVRGFTRDLRYLYQLQLSEASVIVLSKEDIVEPEVMVQAQETLAKNFPAKPIVVVSENNNSLIAALLAEIAQLSIGSSLTIDYDRYADAEAAMGWFDGSFSLTTDDTEKGQNFVADWLNAITAKVRETGGEIGHVKVALNTLNQKLFANVVSTDGFIRFQASGDVDLPKSGSVNARVALPPDTLQTILTTSAEHAAQANNLELRWNSHRAFAPSRPVPTYRIS